MPISPRADGWALACPVRVGLPASPRADLLVEVLPGEALAGSVARSSASTSTRSGAVCAWRRGLEVCARGSVCALVLACALRVRSWGPLSASESSSPSPREASARTTGSGERATAGRESISAPRESRRGASSDLAVRRSASALGSCALAAAGAASAGSRSSAGWASGVAWARSVGLREGRRAGVGAAKGAAAVLSIACGSGESLAARRVRAGLAAISLAGASQDASARARTLAVAGRARLGRLAARSGAGAALRGRLRAGASGSV